MTGIDDDSDDGAVLSDLHVGTGSGRGFSSTRFEFLVRAAGGDEDADSGSGSDEDAHVPRKRAAATVALHVAHARATPVRHVALQVWCGGVSCELA